MNGRPFAEYHEGYALWKTLAHFKNTEDIVLFGPGGFPIRMEHIATGTIVSYP